jgi:hypothetical protein
MNIQISAIINGFVLTIQSEKGATSIYLPDWEEVKTAINKIEVKKVEPTVLPDSEKN